MADGSSQIFCPYRAIGFCGNHVPLVAQTKGVDSFVVTAVGKSFHVYLCDKLRLLFVGSLQPEPLQCLAIQGRIVFASYGGVIKAFKRGKEVNCYRGHEGEVHTLLPFGEHLVSIDDCNQLKIWHIRSAELYGDIHFSQSSFQITSAVHPSTYLNKILLGSQSGELQLWNIKTNKVIFTFTGWGSRVMCLAQSPAVDVVGIGLENGTLLLHNLKFDETIMKFQQDWGPVTAVSFRTDGFHTVATGSPLGHIAVWDLDNKRLATVLREAHNGAVSGMQFLQSQPLMVTSGPDNTVKMWIFDQSDGSARLLRGRCGHSAPPTRIKFCTVGGDAVKILSGGLDNSLRLLAIHKDVQMNMELSQGSLVKKSRKKGVKIETLKLPAVTDFALETTRAREWDSGVSCHVGHDSAQTWNLLNSTIGRHTLSSRHVDIGARPVCVTLTGCGNFVLLGMSTGHVEMFNMQSGIHRGEFGRPRAHSKSVRGIAVDAVNMEVFTGSGDCNVKFWSFHEKCLLDTISLDSPVSSMVYHRESSMLAVSCDNFTISIVDTTTRRVVRTFTGHRNRITDMTFSPDGRWLVSSSMDCSIRTFDLPSGRMIDLFLVESPATSLALSPTGDFLASTHIDDLGIYLWSNKTLYSHVSLRPLPPDYTPTFTQLPTTSIVEVEKEEENIDGAHYLESESDNAHIISKEDITETSTPLEDGLVTLSELPKSRWHNLLNLDTIKQRNKPIEPPKQPKQAPFFLPTLPGLEMKFVPADDDNEGGIPTVESSGSRILDLGKFQTLSEFQKCLVQCAGDGRYDPLMELLKGLPPAAVDSEFRSLSPDAGGSVEWLGQLMHFLLDQLKTNRNYELIQSYIGLFLKLHSNAIAENAELASLCEQLLSQHLKSWTLLQEDLNMSACLVSYCKSATI